jgi:hypothetical protein
MTIPPEYKLKPEGAQSIEKWIFRKSFESILPESVVWRSKEELFSRPYAALRRGKCRKNRGKGFVCNMTS